MIKIVLCIQDFAKCWSEGNYYELLNTDKGHDKEEDYEYHIRDNFGEKSVIYGDDFEGYFKPVCEEIKITIELLRQMSSFMEQIDERCTAILEWKDKHDPNNLIWDPSCISYGITGASFLFEQDFVSFSIHETWAYGGEEYHYHRIPFTEIISDGWHKEFLNKVKEKKEQIEAERLNQEKGLKERREAMELAEYERLKEKYESAHTILHYSNITNLNKEG